MRAQDPHSQIENDEIPGGEYPNENDSEVTRTNKTSAIPNFIPQILPDDEIAKDTNSLNSEQREVFNEVHTWAKDYVKYDGFDVEPADIFLSKQCRDRKISFDESNIQRHIKNIALSM